MLNRVINDLSADRLVFKIYKKKHKFFLATTILLGSSFILPSKEMIKKITPPPFTYFIYAVDPEEGTIIKKNWKVYQLHTRRLKARQQLPLTQLPEQNLLHV